MGYSYFFKSEVFDLDSGSKQVVPGKKILFGGGEIREKMLLLNWDKLMDIRVME